MVIESTDKKSANYFWFKKTKFNFEKIKKNNFTLKSVTANVA